MQKTLKMEKKKDYDIVLSLDVTVFHSRLAHCSTVIG